MFRFPWIWCAAFVLGGAWDVGAVPDPAAQPTTATTARRKPIVPRPDAGTTAARPDVDASAAPSIGTPAAAPPAAPIKKRRVRYKPKAAGQRARPVAPRKTEPTPISRALDAAVSGPAPTPTPAKVRTENRPTGVVERTQRKRTRPDAGAAAVAESTSIVPDVEGTFDDLALLLLAVGCLFLLLRLIARAIAALAASGRPGAVVAARLWPAVEWTVLFAALGVVLVTWVGPQGSVLLSVVVAMVGLMIALQWRALQDVAAGTVFALERTFHVGDIVRIRGVEGQLRRLGIRFLELESRDGQLVQIPYRDALGATERRAGGASVAHAVTLEFRLPSGIEPSEALESARCIASGSCWAVIGASPKVELCPDDSGARVSIEAYAFSREAKSHLYADLLAGSQNLRGRGAGAGQ